MGPVYQSGRGAVRAQRGAGPPARVAYAALGSSAGRAHPSGAEDAGPRRERKRVRCLRCRHHPASERQMTALRMATFSQSQA